MLVSSQPQGRVVFLEDEKIRAGTRAVWNLRIM